VFVFKLDGDGAIPQPAVPTTAARPSAKPFGTPAMIALGKVQFHRNCMVCHGLLAISSGVTPDLRWSSASADPATWKSIVLDGALKDAGMVSFRKEVSPAEAEAIRSYVVARANEKD